MGFFHLGGADQAGSDNIHELMCKNFEPGVFSGFLFNLL